MYVKDHERYMHVNFQNIVCFVLFYGFYFCNSTVQNRQESKRLVLCAKLAWLVGGKYHHKEIEVWFNKTVGWREIYHRSKRSVLKDFEQDSSFSFASKLFHKIADRTGKECRRISSRVLSTVTFIGW